MKTYRAAILFTADRQGSTVLTGPEDAHLSDADLMTEARAEIKRANIADQIEGCNIEIADWTE